MVLVLKQPDVLQQRTQTIKHPSRCSAAHTARQGQSPLPGAAPVPGDPPTSFPGPPTQSSQRTFLGPIAKEK